MRKNRKGSWATALVLGALAANLALASDVSKRRYEYVFLVFNGCLAGVETILARSELSQDWTGRLLLLQRVNRIAPDVAGVLFLSADTEPDTTVRELMGSVVSACSPAFSVSVERENPNFGHLLAGAIRQAEGADGRPPFVVLDKREAMVHSPTFRKQ